MFLNVPQLKTQLESIWVALPAEFVSAKQNLYSTGLKTNKFQLFLRPGSQLKTLPKGLEGELCFVCHVRKPQTTRGPLRPIISSGFMTRGQVHLLCAIIMLHVHNYVTAQIDLIDMRHRPDGHPLPHWWCLLWILALCIPLLYPV